MSTLEDNLRNAFATSNELSTQNRKLTQQMKEQQRIYEKRNNDAISIHTQTNSAQLIDAGIQVDLLKQLKIRDNGNIILFVSFDFYFSQLDYFESAEAAILRCSMEKAFEISRNSRETPLLESLFSDIAGLLHTKIFKMRLCDSVFSVNITKMFITASLVCKTYRKLTVKTPERL